MNKNVRTKINKSERIEIRCTKAFKEKIQELAVLNEMTISQFIESICTDKIKNSLEVKEIKIPNKEEVVKGTEKTSNAGSSTKNLKSTPKRTKREEYEKEIWRMLQENVTPTETANWLNENGFKPQRGEKFTMNSVHSIRKRLKKQNQKNSI